MNKTETLIMLVEDESAIASTIIYALEREHFHVKHFLTGIEAEQYWISYPVDLAILDVGLPDQSGFELCRKLKATHAERPVMFLTAQQDEIDRIVGLELGADDYVCKPFSPRELVLRVKTILRRHQSTNDSPVTSCKFKHDKEKKQITFKNKKLTLTKSEYLLLSAMMNHPGRVFTRDNLLDALNDTSVQSNDRAIDTHIKELRGKLRTIDESCEAIITHRGLGYSLDESE